MYTAARGDKSGPFFVNSSGKPLQVSIRGGYPKDIGKTSMLDAAQDSGSNFSGAGRN